MSEIVGVVAEFNPFHEGHEYLLKKAKEISGAKYAVCAMSGDYVQRGEPACISKYVRAKRALKRGADVILGMPVYTSLSSAGEFANGCVRALINAGVDAIAFGCEDVRIADMIGYIKDHIMESGSSIEKWASVYMRMGDPYPVAREKAFREICSMPEEYIELIRTPNNLLVYEYLKTVCEMGAADKVRIIPVKREGMAHDSEESTDAADDSGNGFPSASFVRKKMRGGDGFYDYISEYGENYKFMSWMDFSEILYYRLLMTPKGELAQIKDVSEDLSGRIAAGFQDYKDPEDFLMKLKNRSVTYTRLSRALMQTVLKLPKRKDRPDYAYLLGYREEAAEVLHLIKKRSRLPMVTKAADARKQLNWTSYEFYQMDKRANELYVRLASKEGHESLKPDHQMSPIIVTD